MLRISPAATIADLRRRIAAAIASRDFAALYELRQILMMLRLDSVRAAELSSIMSPVKMRIEAAIARISLDQFGKLLESIQRAIAELTRTISSWFRQSIYQESSRLRTEISGYWLALLTPSQLRRITGLPIDATGALKPRPGIVPPNLTDDGMSLREMLLKISPLIVMPGDSDQDKRSPLVKEVLGDVASGAMIEADVTASVPAISKPWPPKLDFILQELVQTGQEITAQLTARSETGPAVKRLQLGFESARENLLQELSHETNRIRGRVDDEIGRRLPDDIYAGYTLHSRFAARTAPDHAARDGQRFYKDNRQGSAANWSNRIIPPYRKNCLCFTIPILETPEGETYDAEFGIRVSGDSLISIRDVGTWQSWFDQQQVWVHKRLMGERRWFAAASTGNGRPTWSDFVKPDGSILSLRRLLGESVTSRQRRKDRVAIIINEQAKRHFDAWERGDGRFDSSPEVEAEYRRRLDAFLRKVLK